MQKGPGLQDCISNLLQPFREEPIDLVARINAMGFILGVAVANTLRKGFVAIRKAGHLCVETCSQDYTDYTASQKQLEMRTDAIQTGIVAICIEDSEGGRWIQEHYKCSQCIPQHLMSRFNSHQLAPFQASGVTPCT